MTNSYEDATVYEPVVDGSDDNGREPVVVQQTEYAYTEPVYNEVPVVYRRVDRREVINKTIQAVWLVGGIVEALIAIRIFLKLIAANPAAAFADFIYSITSLFLFPFTGLTGQPATTSGAVLEVSSIIAMAVYALFFWLVARLIRLLFD